MYSLRPDLSQLQAAMRRIGDLGQQPTKAPGFKHAFEQLVAGVKAEADTMVPVMTRTLMRSGRYTINISGGRAEGSITYGGQAAQYGERLHNTEGWKPGGSRGKWLYGPSGAAHPGEWNPPRGAGRSASSVQTRNRKWAKGNVFTSRGPAGGWWRRATVFYSWRKPMPKTYNPKAASHWLFGKAWSGWRVIQKGVDRIVDVLRSAVGEAAGGGN